MKRSGKTVRKRLRQGTYLLPAAFTIGNMLMGFYAVVLGLGHRFEPAALLIFGAAVLDALDGRIARLSGTESEFGREYDSLADVLTFGMAPALLVYSWGLGDWDRIGWLVPLFYLVCTATRLARFNVQASADYDSRYFVGLPAPAAACSVAAVLFFVPDRSGLEEPWYLTVAALLMLALACLGILMVSTFRYSSFKQLDLRKRWSYRGLIPVAAVLLTAVWQPPAFFLAVGILYTSSGPLGWLIGRLRRRGGEGEAAA
ncbi:MAG: CDP-diacylglycerol--serine O-phosphatidyltransferase [Acidobacteria bacterium]|nr:CDP-diacylglycerol--serine O-phosphatidyltransferase [Acidobacteriota bacterium]